jgi:uncharacterized protein YyaL (SSP411 family)
MRAGRTPPTCDDKIVAEWNGLALMALAEAARATHEEQYRSASQAPAAFLASTLIHADRIVRTWRDGQPGPTGVLAAYAAMGFLAQYQSDFDLRWFDEAERLGDVILRRFRHAAAWLFDTASDHEALIVRPRSLQDSPTPSGNALACMLFLQLDTLTNEAEWRQAADRLLGLMSMLAAQHPTGFAYWLCAADAAGQPSRQLALAGDTGDPAVQALGASRLRAVRALPGHGSWHRRPAGTAAGPVADPRRTCRLLVFRLLLPASDNRSCGAFTPAGGEHPRSIRAPR